MIIRECKVNHLTNPIGYEMERIVFSWKVDDARGKRQKTARIRVSTDAAMEMLCYDSGENPALDFAASEIELALTPRTRYFWTVEVMSDAGERACSDINYFETAKLNEPWAGRWITTEKGANHPVFGKYIAVSRPLASARLYISALGLYEARIDGARVGEEYLTPYCNNYNAWIQYQTFDVTALLQNGGRLEVTVADGWAIGRFGYFSKPWDAGVYRKDYELLAELRLTYADGGCSVIGTDETWEVLDSIFVRSGIYDGEWQDAAAAGNEEQKRGCCRGQSVRQESVRGRSAFYIEENVPLVARRSTPVTVRREIAPIALLETPKGELVFDMGQNLVGIFRMKVDEAPGTRIHLSFGEVLQDQCFYRENLRSALAEFDYICKGGKEEIEPHFTFYGFRYVKVEGVSGLCADDFTALVLHSEISQIGHLKTGNEKLNRLIANIEWGQRGNFVDVPTDCPQRDERLGWTGDTQVFSATALYLTDCYAFYNKFLIDLWTEQQALGGMVPDIVPSLDERYQSCSSVWGDAACIIPWNLYQFSGDVSILKECYPSMRAWVDYIKKVDGLDHGWGRHFHYGDWLALDQAKAAKDERKGGTDEAYIAYVYYANSADIVARSAVLVGKEADAASYAALRDKICDKLRYDYFTPSGRCAAGTQTGVILALRYGLMRDSSVLKEQLLTLLDKSGGKLTTGFTGTPFLLAQLCEIGQRRLAYDILLNEEYPGWLYAVNLGATTVWERWNSMNPDGTVSSTGMNSFNHYAYGSVAEWMYAYMAGLRQKQGTVGFRNAVIDPVIDARVGSCAMSYDSASGRYEVNWVLQKDGHVRITVTVPFGCEADIVLPEKTKKTVHVEAGMYEYVIA